jgi:hypothetical protein
MINPDKKVKQQIRKYGTWIKSMAMMDMIIMMGMAAMVPMVSMMVIMVAAVTMVAGRWWEGIESLIMVMVMMTR